MKEISSTISPLLAHTLISEELFDLTLYRGFERITRDTNLKKILGELVAVEIGHVAFWEQFFLTHVRTLSVFQKIKLSILIFVARVGGVYAIHMILEAIEIYGIKKYLKLWESYKGKPLGDAIQKVLVDELKHEDEIVSQMFERKISPDRIRSIFLGFNDGSVEILGAVSGFFAVFQNPISVIIASVTVAIAGAISMGAGSYAALSSEAEVSWIEKKKLIFLNTNTIENGNPPRPFSSALLVACSYFVGASTPILPILLGFHGVLPSVLFAGGVIILVSLILAFLSGMNIMRRIALNLGIIFFAVSVSYMIGLGVKEWFGLVV